MSYILEALKKADQDRDIGAVPGIATPHEVERPRGRSRKWLWILSALLIVNVFLVVMLLTDRFAEVPEPAWAQPEPQAAQVSQQPAQPVRQPGEVGIGVAPTAETPEPIGGQRMLSNAESATMPEPASAGNSRPLPGPDRITDARPDLMSAMSAETGVARLQSWYELPSELRSGLTLPRLDLHVYSDDPQSRFILVNLKKYREGERLESGLMLEEVLPEGMVMSYRGERFLVEK
jgi:general secretion pathway protein B